MYSTVGLYMIKFLNALNLNAQELMCSCDTTATLLWETTIITVEFDESVAPKRYALFLAFSMIRYLPTTESMESFRRKQLRCDYWHCCSRHWCHPD